MSNEVASLRDRATQARAQADQWDALANEVEESLGVEIGTGTVAKRGRPVASTGTGKRGRPKGSTNKPRVAGDERVKGQSSLREVILSVLKEHKAGCDLATVVEGVLKKGYVSTGNISQNVSTNLYNMRIKDESVEHDKTNRVYKLKVA